MWPQVEQDLAQLLTSTPFPDLRGVTAYDDLLKPLGRPNPALCKAFAHNLLTASDLTSGIRELGSRENPKVKVWDKPICRAVSPKARRDGRWWFDEELVQRWSQKYPPGTPGRKQLILDSLRPMLAVCFDWNGFTDLVMMRPSSIPVVTGQGKHKPIHSGSSPLHDPKETVVFIGGFTQVFLPFVKAGSISNYVF